MAKVRDKKLMITYGQRILDAGFYAIPNLLLDRQLDLNLSNAELVFFIKVTHFYSKEFLTDDELAMPLKNRAVRSVRRALIEKGYLACEILKERGEHGQLRTIGIKYDWSGLIEALNAPSGKKMQVTERQKNAPAIMSTERQKNAAHIRNVKEGVKEGVCGKEDTHTHEKKSFAPLVAMTEVEYADLVKRYSEAGAKRMVEILNAWKLQTGKDYKSDYGAMLGWVYDRYQKELVGKPKSVGSAKPVEAEQIIDGKKRYEAIKKQVEEEFFKKQAQGVV